MRSHVIVKTGLEFVGKFGGGELALFLYNSYKLFNCDLRAGHLIASIADIASLIASLYA